MTASYTAPCSDADIIATAATMAEKSAAKPPAAKRLAQALLRVEKAAKGDQLDVDALHGTWQLCFTVPNKPRLQNDQSTRRGFYIPHLLRAEIGFQPQVAPTPLAIHNQLTVGPLRIRFTGNAKAIGKNLVAFEFTQIQVDLARFRLYQGQINTAPLPAEERPGKAAFFSFFATSGAYIAARGRGGGLALWAKLGSANP